MAEVKGVGAQPPEKKEIFEAQKTLLKEKAEKIEELALKAVFKRERVEAKTLDQHFVTMPTSNLNKLISEANEIK